MPQWSEYLHFQTFNLGKIWAHIFNPFQGCVSFYLYHHLLNDIALKGGFAENQPSLYSEGDFRQK